METLLNFKFDLSSRKLILYFRSKNVLFTHSIKPFDNNTYIPKTWM